MKNILESISLIFGIIGLVYLIYLFFIEIKSFRLSKNKDRFFLALILILVIIGLIKDKIQFLF